LLLKNFLVDAALLCTWLGVVGLNRTYILTIWN
jgi:hypothetical protein